jgi:hypothetical protein
VTYNLNFSNPMPRLTLTGISPNTDSVSPIAKAFTNAPGGPGKKSLLELDPDEEM